MLMPAKNSVKVYAENGFYHLYNRGVEKRDIFLDHQDYAVFLSYLKEYLTPKDTENLYLISTSKEYSYEERQKAQKKLLMNNFFGEIELLAYVLMPNHFHLLLKQNNERSMENFLNSIGTRYTMYFNRRYKRVGSLYQGVYKAVLIGSDEQLLHVSRYIHLNPEGNTSLPSSLPDYLGSKQTGWIKTNHLLNYFSKTNPQNSYSSFMSSSTDSNFIADKCLDLDFEQARGDPVYQL